MRAMRSALAGAMTTRVAHEARLMCAMSQADASNGSWATGARDSTLRVSGVTKRRAFSVGTTRTSAPALTSERTMRQALYAAMEPETPSSIFAPRPRRAPARGGRGCAFAMRGA